MKKELLIKNLFIKERKSLSIAESCTGGLVSHSLTNIPGAAGYFKLGIVAYSNQAKISILKIPPQIIQKYGVISKETVSFMAKNIRKIGFSDIGLGITGIAGPSGGTKEKPVGTVFIAYSDRKKIVVKKFIFKGNRISIKKQSLNKALEILQMLI
ncbi:MAG: CinA family protein [Candidatus Omnitrophota bacterium]